MNLTNKDQQRLGKAVRKTERSNPPSLGGDYDPRRGGGDRTRFVRPTSITSDAIYQGKIQKGNATEPTLMGMTDGTVSCIIINSNEIGSTSGPILNLGKIYAGQIIGIDADTKHQMVLVSGGAGDACNTSSSSSGGG